MSGYSQFRKAMKGYRNPKLIGFTVGELVSINPIQIEVYYDETSIPYQNFRSLVDFSNVTEDDIGKKYIVTTGNNNNDLFVLGEVVYYA